ncbi:hypothetical protein KXV18_001401 [Aspergillus fumigatus]|nr:hypothetical protein KXX45_000191 [Aspergillus fumigatus]KAH2619714.1 hypothetical protein KXV18_001401 [Aspergillus fumigatus]KAH2635841.1 hypothetical protein KXW54_002772 [Aspergillus fumigatus]
MMTQTPEPALASQPATSHPLIHGIDIYNPDPVHERNAELLRAFPIDRNVFRLFARSSGLFPPILDTLNALLDGKTRTIQILDYQLVVLRMTGLVGAEYLFGINEPVSRVHGMGDERIEALRKGLKSEELFAMGIWSERQQCIITLVDESVATWTNTEETVAWAKTLMTDDEIVEVFIVLGFYSMIARITRGLRVQKDKPIPHLNQSIVEKITKNSNDLQTQVHARRTVRKMLDVSSESNIAALFFFMPVHHYMPIVLRSSTVRARNAQLAPAPSLLSAGLLSTHATGMAQSSEPAYLEVARRKQAQLDSGIPTEWRLPAGLIPAGMFSPPIADTRSHAYPRVSVMDIPRRSSLLTPKELGITEDWDVRGLLAQMRQGTLSAEDVVRAFSKRAAIAHQVTRCLTEPLFPSAIQRAQQLDSILQRTGKPVGPLHGLPVSVKDCFRIKGVDSCIGLTALAFKPSTSHARLVTMLLSLGAVIIAKTNVSQGMAAPDSYNHVFGRTLNPLNHQLTVGGSSGGEAALVAMRGSMVGFGTDIGGSIRVPAMCTGLYGFKPSVGRIPFGGVVTGQPPGLGRVSLQGVAGPLARSVADLGTVLDAIVPIAERFGEDCIPAQWESESPVSERQTREFTVGVLRTDGLVTPLPPVARVLDEVAESLRRTPGVRVVDVPVPPGLSKCQGIAGRLMSADGGGSLLDLLQSTSEPLIPWLQKRIKRREALTLEQLVHLQEQRSDVEKELLGMWTVDGDCTRRIDAIITPVAPHPVPEIDRFNAIGYTASFVLLDYPAGTIPVRNLTESDLDSDQGMNSPELGSWDRVNRDLWQGQSVDRRVYLDSPLSIQVVTPKQHDYELFQAMEIIDRAIQSQKGAT